MVYILTLIHILFSPNSKCVIFKILPWLLQRYKKCFNLHSTMYPATLQLFIRNAMLKPQHITSLVILSISNNISPSWRLFCNSYEITCIISYKNKKYYNILKYLEIRIYNHLACCQNHLLNVLIIKGSLSHATIQNNQAKILHKR